MVIYRDGVGDGQLPAVVEHELPQILDTFKTAGTDYKYDQARLHSSSSLGKIFFKLTAANKKVQSKELQVGFKMGLD